MRAEKGKPTDLNGPLSSDEDASVSDTELDEDPISDHEDSVEEMKTQTMQAEEQRKKWSRVEEKSIYAGFSLFITKREIPCAEIVHNAKQQYTTLQNRSN